MFLSVATEHFIIIRSTHIQNKEFQNKGTAAGSESMERGSPEPPPIFVGGTDFLTTWYRNAINSKLCLQRKYTKSVCDNKMNQNV